MPTWPMYHSYHLQHTIIYHYVQAADTSCLEVCRIAFMAIPLVEHMRALEVERLAELYFIPAFLLLPEL